MFCTECGAKINDSAKFCNQCGFIVTRNAVLKEGVILEGTTEIINEDFTESLTCSLEAKSIANAPESSVEKNRIKKKSPIKILVIVLCALIAVLSCGIFLQYMDKQQRQKTTEENSSETHEEDGTDIEDETDESDKADDTDKVDKISSSLERLGNRALGNKTYATEFYIEGLSKLASALVEDTDWNSLYVNSGYDGTKKSYYLEELKENYINYDEDTTYDVRCSRFMILLFGCDYLSEKDIDYFEYGIIPQEMLEPIFMNIVANSGIYLGTLLMDKRDREICYNFCLKIDLAKKGYLSVGEVADEIYDFATQNKTFNLLSDEILETNPSMSDIGNNISGSFNGEAVMYDELTTSGKLIFLYFMPEYLKQSSAAGSIEGTLLWNDFFQREFNILWRMTTFSEIYSDVIYTE